MSFREAQQRLDSLRRAARRAIVVETLGAAGSALAAYALFTLLVDRMLRLELGFRAVLLLGFAVLLVRIVRDRFVRPMRVELGEDELALALERSQPQLQQALISSVQFERRLEQGKGAVESPALMQAVVDDVRSKLPAVELATALDRERARRNTMLLAGAAAVFGAWTLLDAGSLGLWAARNLALSSVEWPRHTRFSFVDAGPRVRMPQGDSLTLRVAVEGPVPDQAFVTYRFATGERGVEPMSMTGPREFSWTLDAVLASAEIRVEGGDGLSEPLFVDVVERPRIEDLAVRLVFPAYMEREPEELGAAEGDLRVPRGGRLEFRGRSHKPLEEAFLLTADEKKVAMTLDAPAADGSVHGFTGSYAPEQSMLVVVDVIDRDRLGAGQPPRLQLRVVEDRPPQLDFKLRGIGNLVCAQARIPGDLRAKDDFGLRSLTAGYRTAVEAAATAEASAQPAAEAPFQPAPAAWGEALPAGALRHDTTVLVDLLRINGSQDENDPANLVRPGMNLSLRIGARDNFGPGDPHESFTETLVFRVVTRERLIEELRRRQVEQRMELQRILDEERTVLLEVREMLNPTAADERAKAAQARLRAVSRQQTSLGRRAAFVAETYGRILLEYENNRLIEPAKVREIENAITVPLAGLGKEDFPRTARQVGEFAAAGDEAVRTAAAAGIDQIVARLQAVLQRMEQAETLAALLEDLRGVIKLEDRAILDVETTLKNTLDSLFGPGPGKESQPKTGGGK
ncbi:MAG: hypothetical protein RIT25_1278 [Planctomycetota bacterium]